MSGYNFSLLAIVGDYIAGDIEYCAGGSNFGAGLAGDFKRRAMRCGSGGHAVLPREQLPLVHRAEF
jgi:hypothetical protein